MEALFYSSSFSGPTEITLNIYVHWIPTRPSITKTPTTNAHVIGQFSDKRQNLFVSLKGCFFFLLRWLAARGLSFFFFSVFFLFPWLAAVVFLFFAFPSFDCRWSFFPFFFFILSYFLFILLFLFYFLFHIYFSFMFIYSFYTFYFIFLCFQFLYSCLPIFFPPLKLLLSR